MPVDALEQAKYWLLQDEAVAIPTETVYGLAANALHPKAVSKIFAIKNRPTFDPLIVHCSHYTHFEHFASTIPPEADKLAEAFIPGPLTLLLPKLPIIPDLVTAGLPRVALRVPNHPLTQALLQAIDFPLAAPSANPFGYISPTTAQHVADQLGDKIPYVLDGGACGVGLESTILGWEDGKPVVYRLGGIAIESLEAVLQQKIQLKLQQNANPQAAGMLDSHYAPRKPLWVGYLSLADFLTANPSYQTLQPEKVGVLRFREASVDFPIENQRILSPQGDATEAAIHFFDYLRQLDAMPINIILAEWLPENGLGKAINDRLQRASVKK